MIRSSVALLLCSVATLVIGGCDSGPPVGTVTGTVTMDGEPLSNARVSFVPQGGGETAIGETDASGNYELNRLHGPGAIVGTYKVVVTTVQAPQADTLQAPSDSEAYAEAMSDRAAYARAPQEPIPARYNKQSEIVEEVEQGDNVINLELTSR